MADINTVELGPLLYGDDYVRPRFEKRTTRSATDRRPKPSPVVAYPTAMTRSSSTLYRDLAETHPWYGSHDGATWSILESGVRYPDLSFSESDREALNVAIRNKIKSQNTNLAVSMAEFREVGPMFLSLARDIIRGYRYVKRDLPWEVVKTVLSKRKNDRFSKAVSRRYIEFTFGISPLMSDVLGLGDEIARKLEEGVVNRISVSRHWEDFKEGSSTYGPVGGSLNRYYTQTWFASRQLSLRRTAYYKINSAGLRRASALGFLNPAEVLWELTPFSFVVDWAIPVGDWLASMDALVGVELLSVVEGAQYTYSGSDTLSGGSKTGTSSLHTIRKTRTTGHSLSIGFPKYSPSTSLKTVLTGTALLQLLRKEI